MPDFASVIATQLDPNHVLKKVVLMNYGPHPGYISGRYYVGNHGSLVTTTVAVGAVDTIYFNLMFLPFAVSIAALLARTGTGGAGSSMKSAVWANSSVSNRPLGAPLIVDNTGQATTGSSTNVEVAVSPSVTLPSGFYWYGTKFTGTLPTMVAMGGTSQAFPVWGGAPANNALIAVGISFADAFANNMPTFAEGASFTVNTTANQPVLGFKVT